MSSFSSFCSSNLERFLQCVTPIVPSRPLPQCLSVSNDESFVVWAGETPSTEVLFVRDGAKRRYLSFGPSHGCFDDLNSLWQPPGKDKVEYFTLRDLWNCYNEWSAYGAGTPVLLNSGDAVMQYYVPYLSALQIYTNKSAANSRNRKEDGDVVEFETDSWSDDSASDKLSRSLSNNSSRAWDAVSEDSSLDHEGAWLTRERLGCLYVQYIEMASPYWRVPLVDKITELASSYPALMTLKNVDLSPASWMAVAWYPIYHIPSRKKGKDLTACFLTYHTLSSTFQDNTDTINTKVMFNPETARTIGDESKEESSGGISLSPFGLATYKLQGDIWIKPQTSDRERMIHLYSAAESWLKQLSIRHHDFNFFSYRSTM